MNCMKLNSLRTLRNLRLVQSPPSRQLPAPITTFVRHIGHADDPSARYEVAVATPLNCGILYVPKKMAYVVQRYGDYWKTLSPGLHILNPIVYEVAFVHCLQEETICIRDQPAITMDNVNIMIDGVLYVQIVDPVLASYNVRYPLYAVIQLAHAIVRCEACKITFEKTSKGVDTLQEKIAITINETAKGWGLKCHRFKIRNISETGGGFQKLLRYIKLFGMALKVVELAPSVFGSMFFGSKALQRKY